MALLQILKNPKSSVSEAYRTLRTNIQFSSTDIEIKTIVVTSSGAGEGKSTTSANMAVAMAQSGHKVLLLDCDLRKPMIHKLFKLSNEIGLTQVVAANTDFNEVIQRTSIAQLKVITSGAIPPNPSELLNSKRMAQLLEKLESHFDYIIIDTPPVNIVTDAQVLAGKCSGTVLVAASRQADRRALAEASDLLKKVGANLLGVVLNKVKRDGVYNKYYNNGYYYSK